MKKTILLVVLLTNFIGLTFAQTKVQFVLKDLPTNNQLKVGLRGNATPLSWDKSLSLTQNGDNYEIEVTFAEEIKNIEFKFVLFEDDKQPKWEGIQNRTLDFTNLKDSKVVSQWDEEPLVDISKLEKIPAEKLMEDYHLIEKMVMKVHPGATRYRTEKELLQILRELKSKFQKPMTHGEAYLAMSKVTAFLQCDHTKVGFNNQNRLITTIIHRQKDKMPFTFRWIDNEMILIHNASGNNQLKKGTKILTINDVKVGHIKTAMLPYIAADGATDANRVRKMEVDGFDFRYNAFDVFYPLLYPFKGKIRLDVIFPNEDKISEVFIEPMTREERFKTLTSRYSEFPKSRDDLWKYEIIDKKTAVLTINSFGLMGWKSMTIDYKKFLAEAFNEFKSKKIKHLIIDARWNTGGSDEMKNELFSYLRFGEEFNFEREGRTRYTTFPEQLKPHIKTWGDSPWYYDLKPDSELKNEGYYVFKEKNGDIKYPKRKTQFKGKVYLLSSSLNTSLAYYLALDFRIKEIGTIIGQETGGNLKGINGGQILFMTLPNSTIEIDFPVMGGFPLQEYGNHGIVPDVEVKPTYEDILNNVDTEMKAALKLIKK